VVSFDLQRLRLDVFESSVMVAAAWNLHLLMHDSFKLLNSFQDIPYSKWPVTSLRLDYVFLTNTTSVPLNRILDVYIALTFPYDA
jgi:hypothetical protein